jgi:hypothetical protein
MIAQKGRVCQKCGTGAGSGPLVLTTVAIDPQRFPNAAREGWTYGLCAACREMSPEDRRRFEEGGLVLLELASLAAPLVSQMNRDRAAASPALAAGVRAGVAMLREKTLELYRQASQIRGIVDVLSDEKVPVWIRDSDWKRSLDALSEAYETMRRTGTELANSVEREFFQE